MCDGKLAFSYVHNDTLFNQPGQQQIPVSGWEIPQDLSSLCGYVAVTGQPLKIDDAYNLDSSLPFCFNRSFDTRPAATAPAR